ncbi:MAG TPA: DNA cytosine methyltransferase [Hyalangium sp.]|nr:DNA cytosine methyltransferase [Hyalangium sp.]
MKRGLVVDLFAGGGGASVGIEAALGRPVDVAINHSATALAVHAANHPRTRHLTADIWEVRPKDVTKGRPVDVLWASPDCTHFSVAKGGTPREKGIRSLAWVVVEWAQAVRPRCIFLENVSEFRTWGPLGLDGKPDKSRMGETFEQWRGALELLGYAVDFRVLDASLYGAPTRRRRLFMVARCDGEPIRWPEPTHGPGRLALRTAAECIDWELPCPSIFERERPLAEKTLWRIAEGLKRFVLNNPRPFIVGVGGRAGQTPATDIEAPMGTITAKNDRALVEPFVVKVNHGGRTDRSEPIDAPLSTVTASRRGHALVAPSLVQTGYGEREGQAPRVLDLHQPLGTVVAQGQKHALVSAFLAKHFTGVVGQGMEQPTATITAKDHHSLAAATLVKLRGECSGADIEEPMPTLTASGTHIAEVRAFLMTYYSNGSQWQALQEPMRTITAKHRLGIVTVEGVDLQIVDIGMRMLEPHELLRAQFGRFAERYDLSAAPSKAAKVRLIGNSVAPEVAEAVIAANVPRSSQREAAA